MEKYELMEMSIMKNIQELSELCVDYGITNVYDLYDALGTYQEIKEKAKRNGGIVTIKLEESESEE